MKPAQFVTLTLLLVAFTRQPAFAVLKVGDEAPDFAADAALGGKPFTFRLAEALAKGPVVLYFYPKAFTTGCTIESDQEPLNGVATSDRNMHMFVS